MAVLITLGRNPERFREVIEPYSTALSAIALREVRDLTDAPASQVVVLDFLLRGMMAGFVLGYLVHQGEQWAR